MFNSVEEYVKSLRPDQCVICEEVIDGSKDPFVRLTSWYSDDFPEMKPRGELRICKKCYLREIQSSIYWVHEEGNDG